MILTQNKMCPRPWHARLVPLTAIMIASAGCDGIGTEKTPADAPFAMLRDIQNNPAQFVDQTVRAGVYAETKDYKFEGLDGGTWSLETKLYSDKCRENCVFTYIAGTVGYTHIPINGKSTVTVNVTKQGEEYLMNFNFRTIEEVKSFPY